MWALCSENLCALCVVGLLAPIRTVDHRSGVSVTKKELDQDLCFVTVKDFTNALALKAVFEPI